MSALGACRESPLRVSRADGAPSDAVVAGDLGDAQDASDAGQGGMDGPCALLCPASSTNVTLSGTVSLRSGDAAEWDVDSLILTVCLDDLCATLPRAPVVDGQAAPWACPDAGALCTPKVFGGSGLPALLYANVALTPLAGHLYSVVGSVAFPLARETTVASQDTRFSIGVQDKTFLEVTAGACTLSRGCCGNLPYQSCSLTW